MERILKVAFMFILLLSSAFLFGCDDVSVITEEDLVRADEAIYSQVEHLLESGYSELESTKKNRFPYETVVSYAYKSFSDFYSSYFDNDSTAVVVANTVKVRSRTFVYGGDDSSAMRIFTLTALKLCDVFESQDETLKAGDIIVVCEPGAYVEENYNEAAYLTIPIEDGMSLSFLKKNSPNAFGLKSSSLELPNAWHCVNISHETKESTNTGFTPPVIEETFSKYKD